MSPILIKGLVVASGISLGGVGIWQLNEYMTPRTLGDKINKEGLAFLSFTDENKLSEWSTRAQKHKGETNGDGNPIKFSDLTITDTNSTNNEDGKALRAKCRAVSEIKLGEDDEENNLKRLKGWCMISTTVTATSPTGTGVGS